MKLSAPVRSCLLLLPLLSLVASLPAQDSTTAAKPFSFDLTGEEFEIGDELLKTTAAEAAAALGKEVKTSLKDVPVRLATADEIEEVLREEIAPQMRAQFPDEAQAKQQGEAFARIYSRAVFAKYATEAGEILVCEENFNRLAKLMERPALATPEMLRVVLCHEYVHALDQRRYAFDEVLASRKSADAIQAYSAVMEGHAQHVARKVCTANGWGESFAEFSEAIGLTPPLDDPAQAYFARIIAVTGAFAYHDGERFVDAIVKAEGEKAVARAFADPPAETALILEPGWYLDPATRPAVEFDLEKALRKFAAGWDEEDWAVQHVPLMRPQLEASLALLPRARFARLLDDMRQSRVLVVSHKHAPPSTRMVVIALLEFGGATSATEFLVVEEELMRKKDEALATGDIQVEDAVYEPVEKGPVRGMYSSKKLVATGMSLKTWVLVASRGNLMVEINYVGEEVDRDGLLEVATGILDAHAEGPGEKADSKGEGQDG